MKFHKKDIIQFGVWMRNGIAFCTTWLLILMLAYNQLFNVQTIATNSMIKMVIWVAGGVLLFSLIFTRLIIKKWSFIRRLTCFMISVSFYQCLGFYWFDFLADKATVIQWLVFIGIVFVLYLICIAIYLQYSKRRGEIYTQALQKYQQQRSSEGGK